MLRNLLTLLIVCGLSAGFSSASADTLLIEGLQTASGTAGDRPVRGISRTRVSPGARRRTFQSVIACRPVS